jgi:histidinol-phosphate aminotransferase
MTVRFRPEIVQLPAYRPGRNPADLARELGLPDAVKLASNESAYGPLPSVAAAVTKAAGEMNRYPDMAAAELISAIATRFGAEPEQVALGAGSVGLCQQLVTATSGPGDEVLYCWRSFEAYPLLVTAAGARSVQAPLQNHAYDLEALADAISDRTRLVFLCNPNNPTGTATRFPAMEKFLDTVPDGVLVVIDEAYREFVDDPEVPDGLALAGDRENVAVLRTMSKAYGLAGLRLGYCIAAPEIAETLRKVQVPFSVSAIAQAAGLASLRAEGELQERVRQVVAERGRVVDALRGMGIGVPESQANFVWLPLGSGAMAFARGCEQRGVIVRPFAGDGVRVTVGAPKENDRFLDAAAELAADFR